MFSGIVEEVVKVKELKNTGKGGRIVLENPEFYKSLKLGDSIAVNGVCLTISQFSCAGIAFDVMSETVKKTSLNNLATGHRVNIERALPANGRLDGHIVQGHVDCVAKILNRRKNGETVIFEIQHPSEFVCYTVPRGSIAVDGVSLTIAEKKKNIFIIALVDFTRNNTALTDKNSGGYVNIEFDIIGKYIFECYRFGANKI